MVYATNFKHGKKIHILEMQHLDDMKQLKEDKKELRDALEQKT